MTAAARRDAAGRRVAAAAIVVALLGTLVASSAHAQLPYLDPLPFWTPADSLAHRAFHVGISGHGDGRTGWTADRVFVEARLPSGERGCFLVRLPWLRFDANGLPASTRWPGILGAGAEPGWPHEMVVTGFGQLEVGVAGPLTLPLLGPVSGAFAIGVPLGDSRFYPWSAAGLPARAGLTRWFGLLPGWWLGAGAVFLAQSGPGGEVFDPSAFPDGWLTSVTLERTGPTGGLRLGWDNHARSGRRAQELTAVLWLPWGDGSRLGLRGTHEITGSSERAAAWSVGVVWRLAPRPAEVPATRGLPTAATAAR